MAKSKITVEREYDSLHGCDVVTLRRKKGGITISEAVEALRQDNRYDDSTYAVLFSTGFTYQGYGDEEDEEGETLTFIDIGSAEHCPICAKEDAILRWCPECGTFIRRSQP